MYNVYKTVNVQAISYDNVLTATKSLKELTDLIYSVNLIH